MSEKPPSFQQMIPRNDNRYRPPGQRDWRGMFNQGGGASQKIRSSIRWQKLRRYKMAKNPLCEDPDGYHASIREVQPAQQVHHIKPVEEFPELAFHFDNLMSICTACHAVVEQKVRKKARNS